MKVEKGNGYGKPNKVKIEFLEEETKENMMGLYEEFMELHKEDLDEQGIEEFTFEDFLSNALFDGAVKIAKANSMKKCLKELEEEIENLEKENE